MSVVDLFSIFILSFISLLLHVTGIFHFRFQFSVSFSIFHLHVSDFSTNAMEFSNELHTHNVICLLNWIWLGARLILVTSEMNNKQKKMPPNLMAICPILHQSDFKNFFDAFSIE